MLLILGIQESSTDMEGYWLQCIDGYIYTYNYIITPYRASINNINHSASFDVRKDDSQFRNQVQFMNEMSELLPQGLGSNVIVHCEDGCENNDNNNDSACTNNSTSSASNSHLGFDRKSSNEVQNVQNVEEKRLDLLQTHIEALTNNIVVMQEQLRLSQEMIRSMKCDKKHD